MKKLLLLIATMSIVAPFASMQAAEIKRSASEAGEVPPPPPDYEDLDIPELIDLLNDQFNRLDLAFINRVWIFDIRSIHYQINTVKDYTKKEQIAQLCDTYTPRIMALIRASLDQLRAKHIGDPQDQKKIAGFENYYILFDALINKLSAKISPLPPIKGAIKRNDTTTVQLWLNRPEYAPDKPNTKIAFGEAIANDKPDIVALFLKNGFDINGEVFLDIPADLAPSKIAFAKLMTPLMGAAFLGYKDIVKLLLDAGADTTITDRDGKTALDLAADDATRDLIRNYSKAIGQELSTVWAEDEQRKEELKAKATTPEEEPAQSSRNPLQLIAEYAGAELPAAAPASATSVSSSATAEPNQGTEPTGSEAGSDDDTTEYTNMPEVD